MVTLDLYLIARLKVMLEVILPQCHALLHIRHSSTHILRWYEDQDPTSCFVAIFVSPFNFNAQNAGKISMDFSDNCSALVKERKNLRRTKFKTPAVPAPSTCLDRDANTYDFEAY